MEKNVVLSDGDKLKEIRIKYGLKQEEITGKEITRNLISEIETNKASITKKTAEIVIKNLTALAKKRNFKVTETVDYLMENQVIQATKVLDNYIKELEVLSISKDNSFIKTLKDAESFLIDWDIKDKKIRIYELAGDYFCNNNEMYKSAIYYEKASALVSRIFLDNKLLPILRKLSVVYIYTAKYNSSVESCNFALDYFKNMTDDEKAVFLHNRALSYRALKNYDLALQDICTLENMANDLDKQRYFETLNLKAICLKSKNDLENALIVYNSMINLLDDNDFEKKIIVYINIAEAYMERNDDKLNEEFSNVEELLFKINNNYEYITDIYFEVAKIYKYLKNTSKAEKYYIKALKSAKLKHEYVLESNILCDLIDIYSELDDAESIGKLKIEFFYLSSNQLTINNIILCKLINFYNKKACTEEVKEISNFVLQFNM